MSAMTKEQLVAGMLERQRRILKLRSKPKSRPSDKVIDGVVRPKGRADAATSGGSMARLPPRQARSSLAGEGSREGWQASEVAYSCYNFLTVQSGSGDLPTWSNDHFPLERSSRNFFPVCSRILDGICLGTHNSLAALDTFSACASN
jgi:hypothetical protein